jgi:outer membrane phospholipase A
MIHRQGNTKNRLFPAAVLAALFAVGLTLVPATASAAINLLAPSRTLDPNAPLRLSLLLGGELDARTYALPEVLRVNLTPDMGATTRIELRRETEVSEQINLPPGEFKRIEYVGQLPANMRGRIRVDAVDVDAPAMLVNLSVPRPATAPALAVASAAQPEHAAPAELSHTDENTPVTTLTVRTNNDPNRQDEGRLSFYEPMFGVIGTGSDANAQFQLSFKLHLYEPVDKTSRDLLDNLYFGYTQTSFWDLTADSKPFLDNNYKPSFFYQIANTDWRVDDNPVGIAAGYEHESNGKDEEDSRSIDFLFVRPEFTYGDPNDFHWGFSPKVYAYIEKSENSDIQEYRGYGDYRFSYGKDNDWRLAWELRKGTRGNNFSSDLQATYPVNRVFPGVPGYFMAQYFTGYGEMLLDYNQREPFSVRFGYGISR